MASSEAPHQNHRLSKGLWRLLPPACRAVAPLAIAKPPSGGTASACPKKGWNVMVLAIFETFETTVRYPLEKYHGKYQGSLFVPSSDKIQRFSSGDTCTTYSVHVQPRSWDPFL